MTTRLAWCSGGQHRAVRAVGARGAVTRLLSRWVLAALAVDVALAVVDATVSSSRILTSSYLIPALAVALFATAEQAAVVAVVSVFLAVASGAWHDFLFTGPHLYRLGIVVAGSGSGSPAPGCVRTPWRLAIAWSCWERWHESPTAVVTSAPRSQRLADLLVPEIADCCAIVSLDPEVAPATVVRCGPACRRCREPARGLARSLARAGCWRARGRWRTRVW